MMFRQGDILLIPVAVSAPPPAPVASTAAVLARGEATGHHHVLHGPARYYADGPEGPLVEVLGPAVLRHEDAAGIQAEHAPLELPPGWYRQVQQREYVEPTRRSPSRSRRVRD